MVAVVDSKEKRDKTALLFLKWDLSRFQQSVRELLMGKNPMELTAEALSELIADLNTSSNISNHVLDEEVSARVSERRYYVYHRLDPKRRLQFTFEEVLKLLKGFVGNDYDEHCKAGGVNDYAATFKKELDHLRENWGAIENPKKLKFILRQIEGGAFNSLISPPERVAA